MFNSDQKISSVLLQMFRKTVIAFFLFLVPLLCLAESPYSSKQKKSKAVFQKNKDKSHSPKRVGSRKFRRKPEKILPQYESCKGVEISSLGEEKKSGAPKDTAAEFCFSCFVKEGFGLGEIKETAQEIQSKAFMKKLKKRVIGQIESKIFQSQVLRACVTQDKNYFRQKNIKWSLMKDDCEKRNLELKTSIKTRWSTMRLNLALSQVHPDQLVAGNPSFSFPLFHKISSFSSIGRLTTSEQSLAKKRWTDQLGKVSLDNFTASEFKERFLKGQLFLPMEKGKYLTSKDRKQLRSATMDMKKKAEGSYFEVMSEMPLLVYLRTGNPNKRELDEAFMKVEDNLADFLKKARDPEADMGLLLSFKPLVEELLKENKEYCLVAERARIQVEKGESLKNQLFLGAGLLAAVPCFIAGPVGASVCLVGGMALGIVGYKQAQTARDESLGRALTGKQFETLAELDARKKEEVLAMLFLPLGAWGTTAVPARAASGFIAKAMKGVPRNTSKTGGKDDLLRDLLKGYFAKSLAKRKQFGEKSLERLLNRKEVEALERAHRVGFGLKEKDNQLVRIGIYTNAQLREKTEILEQAGFSRQEIRKLMKDGVVRISLKPGQIRVLDLSQLSLEQIRTLKVSQLSLEQIRTLKVSQLSPEQVRALNVRYLSLKQVRTLDLRDLSPKQIRTLDASQLSLKQVQKLKVSELTPEQIRALNASKLNSKQFWALNVRNLSLVQVWELDLSKLSPKQFRTLDLSKLSPKQFRTLDLRDLSLKQIRTLDASQLSLKQVQKLKVSELSVEQIRALIASKLSLYQIRTLDLSKLSPKQIRALDLSKLSPKQIRELDASQLSLKQVQELKVSELTLEQIWALNANQLSPKQFRALNVRNLSFAQVWALDLSNLSPAQVRALDLSKLSPKQIRELDARSLTPKQVNGLTLRQVQSLNVKDLNPKQVRELNVRYLSPEQVWELDLNQLSPAQSKALDELLKE